MAGVFAIEDARKREAERVEAEPKTDLFGPTTTEGLNKTAPKIFAPAKGLTYNIKFRPNDK